MMCLCVCEFIKNFQHKIQNKMSRKKAICKFNIVTNQNSRLKYPNGQSEV